MEFLELVVSEEGQPKVEHGKPVYKVKDDDGVEKELAVDVAELHSQKVAANKEAAERRRKLNEARDRLKLFDGIDPEQAKKDRTTVQSLKDKELVDAGEVDKLKAQMGELFQQEKQGLIDGYTAEKAEFEKQIGDLQGTIRHLTITNAFSQSGYFTPREGKPAKTVLSPQMAVKIFGDNFKVEGEGHNVRVVGYLPNGEKILSPTRVGQEANFDEAMAKIIELTPDRDSILRTTGGGPNTSGGHQNDGQVLTILRADARDPVKYRAAKEQADKQGLTLRVAD